MAGDHLELEGTVTKARGNGSFLVQESAGKSLLICTLSGKIRKNTIRILEGDLVKISVSPYDLSRGIITYRIKKDV